MVFFGLIDRLPTVEIRICQDLSLQAHYLGHRAYRELVWQPHEHGIINTGNAHIAQPEIPWQAMHSMHAHSQHGLDMDLGA